MRGKQYQNHKIITKTKQRPTGENKEVKINSKYTKMRIGFGSDRS